MTAIRTSYAIEIDTTSPQLKLYQQGILFRTFVVALGKPQTSTPIGSWHVIDKQSGWGSGFGTRWLGLDVPWGIYGIHGTNRPESIGQYASHGCVRMRNADVEFLYSLLPVGTPVRITGDPLRNLRRLEYGNVGADVQQVQLRLQQLGYYHGICHGKFDSVTQFALVYFELARKLPMDGVVGMDDYHALRLYPKANASIGRER